MFSCKKDAATATTGGGSNPFNPTNCEDPEGTITANLRNDSGSIILLDAELKINTANNFYGTGYGTNSYANYTMTFVNVGEVEGLGCVNTVPQSGWSNQAAVIPGNGYVIKVKYQYWDVETIGYARLYVVRYIKSVSNEILGAELKYEENWNPLPIVMTKEITVITWSTAMCGGDITYNGGGDIVSKGVCWSTTSNPTISDYYTSDGAGIESFTSVLTELDEYTTYYVRAYATNCNGTSYGSQKVFTTGEGMHIPLEYSDTINFDGKIVAILEDYTGVKCNNCPAAAEIAQQLEELYGSHLVVLGVHPKTALQNPSGGFPDFRTDDGQEWNTEFNIGFYPSGLVNRTGGVFGAAQWTSAVSDLIGQDAPIRLIVKTCYDGEPRRLKYSVHAKFLTDVTGDIRLTVCLVEDGIIGKQTTPNGVIEDYMHRHVFRGTADSLTWGMPFDPNVSCIELGRNFIITKRVLLKEEYNLDNMYIVAFVSNNDTKEILMAAKSKIIY